ncbi:glycosyltransferase family 2 protein [Streptomyces sedi]|uniref:GltA n=1 Tax=Streptomyces sedi TaxID=555059 RepID=A0A5C4UNR3_9ACTN|nr:glycosyltransferase [Streptomyces sedi]TNM25166.1 GltA [Streptomyces sedi]
MPTISVITPVHGGSEPYLPDAHRSVAAQRLPDGWDLQWVVQEDGRTGGPLAALPDEPWISPGAGRAGGAARARTLALHRAAGVLTRTLDADDLLPDERTLARDIEALAAHPDLAWTVAPALDLHPDGRLVPGPCDPPPGPLPPELLVDGARVGVLPVMGTTFTVYTALLVAIGGWPALPAYEDVGPLLAAEALSGGLMQAEPGEIYRKHPGQSTADPAYHDAEEKATRMATVIARADALRRLGWKWQPEQPAVV